MSETKSVFETLNSINVNDKVEKKGNLNYLSWAWAWAEVKKKYPDAYYTIYENADGLNYHTDGKTCWVKTGVTINGLEHIEYLPVMDSRNKSIPLEMVTSFNVNTSLQRSITKACARHGLGLYIYAGEDLPQDDDAAVTFTAAKQSDTAIKCECCGNNIEQQMRRDGTMWAVEAMAAYSEKRYGKKMCAICMKKADKEEKDAEREEKQRRMEEFIDRLNKAAEEEKDAKS